MTKSHCLHIFKCQYLIEILRYGANFLHVIITFIGFKIAFSNIRSHGAPLLISRGWRLAPPPGFLTIRNTLGLIGLRLATMCNIHYLIVLLVPVPPFGYLAIAPGIFSSLLNIQTRQA